MANYVLRVEFQGRGTLHVHCALWAVLYPNKDLRGTTGKRHDSPLVRYLTELGFESIDVQYGEGYLNYINGYVAKASDAMDFRIQERHRCHLLLSGRAWRCHCWCGRGTTPHSVPAGE